MLDAIRSAREVAISQRRNVAFAFIGTNAIQTVREDIGARVAFDRHDGPAHGRAGEPDDSFGATAEVTGNTPDGFPQSDADAVTFGAAAPRMFTSEGTFVDANGDILNGTIFMAIPNQANSCAGDHGHGRDRADSIVALERHESGWSKAMARTNRSTRSPTTTPASR